MKDTAVYKRLSAIPQSIVYGAFSFVVYRLIVSLVIREAVQHLPIIGKWTFSPCTPEINHTIMESGRFGYLVAAMYRWDTCNYLLIANDGYLPHVKQTVWPPLFPMLISLVDKIFHLPMLSAMVVSNVAALACFILFFRVVEVNWGSAIARKAIWLLAIYPTAFYLLAGYTESLAMALALACFLALHDRKWILAGVLAAIATLARMQNIVLAAPMFFIAVLDFFRSGRKLPPRLPAILAAMLLPLLAFAGYNSYIHFYLGMPWPSETLAVRWGQVPGWPWVGVIEAVKYLLGRLPGSPASVRYNYTSIVADLSLFGYCVGWLIAGLKLPIPFQVYSWLMLLTPLIAEGSSNHIRSTARYTLSVFPIFVIMALRVKNRWVMGILILISIAAQIHMLVSFYQWIWVA